MNITVSFDQALNSLPAGFATAVNAAVSFFNTTFSDSVSLTLHVGFGEVNGGAIDPSSLGRSYYSMHQYSYASIRTALMSDARSADDFASFADLPATDPVAGAQQFWLNDAQAKALGLMSNATAIDAYVGFGATAAFDYDPANGISPNQYDFQGLVSHEIAEVLGKNFLAGATIGTTANSYNAADLFHYSAPGVRDFSGSTPGYFSIDNGATSLGAFNTDPNGDAGDWAASVGADAWRAFANSGVVNPVGASDLAFLDVLGYDRVGTDLGASGLALGKSAITSGDVVKVTYSINNIGVNAVGASTVGVYMSTDGVFDAGDTLLTTRSIGALAAGGSASDSFDLSLSTTGAYNIIVVANYDKAISETNQTNNASAAAAITVSAPLFTSGDDTVTLPSSGGTWHALAGNDYVTGSTGADYIFGDAGNDTLTGGDELTLTDAQKSIFRLYGATLGREPDAAGLASWTALYNGGSSLASITDGFVNSAEFKSTYGSLNNSQFITLLYNNVLGRAPDAGGLSGWLSLLNGGSSRSTVVDGFSESAEYKANTEMETRGFASTAEFGTVFGQVFRVYAATLNRTPDAAGFEGWTNILEKGSTIASATSGFVGSSEFQTTYGSLSNSQFITLLYNNVLKRAPDAAGFNGWNNLLSGGTSRESVVNGFSESSEFQTNTADALKTFMQTTMSAWADTLNGGAGDDVLVGGRGADTFQFDRNAVGSDQIYGFESWDILNFQNFGYANSSAAASHMTQSGANVVFADQGETITFHNTALSTVTGATMTFA